MEPSKVITSDYAVINPYDIGIYYPIINCKMYTFVGSEYVLKALWSHDIAVKNFGALG